MLQLDNQTPFAAQIALFPDEHGVDTIYLAVRATFDIAPALRVAEQQHPLRPADAYHGEPGRSSLAYAGELHLAKPSTDVVLKGEAWPPRRAPEVDVSLSVGPARKVVRVFGDREWSGAIDARITAPVPFERMPLVYERAFGGPLAVDRETGEPVLDPRNPVGVGVARQRARGEESVCRLPNLEDPEHLIARPEDRPPPAGFGFIAPSWEPRRSRAGTYDQAWRKRRAPYLPEDFQPSFFNTAHPDLVCKGYLQGGEPVEVIHASPVERIRFRLPVCRFGAAVRIDGEVEWPPMNLETVLIEPGEKRLAMVWRGAVACDKRALRVDAVRVVLDALELDGRAA